MTDNAYLIELLQAYPPSHRDSDVVQEIQCLLSKLGMVVQKETDLNSLCKEVEVVVVNKGSVIYMQGEAGSCYFVVLRGAVDLYFEHDIAVEGRLLQQLAPYDLHAEPPDGRCIFGYTVAELQAGSGFGEHLLLANDDPTRSPSKTNSAHFGSPRAQNKTNKGSNKKNRPTDATGQQFVPGRAHSAVSAAADTALLMIHESTYRRVVQKHHSAQQEAVASAMALWRLPLLRHRSFAAALHAAQRSQLVEAHHKVLVAGYHVPIDRVFLVLDGEVRVSGAPSSPQRKVLFEGSSNSSSCVESDSIGTTSLAESFASTSQKFPPLTISVLRAGQVVGETEVHRGLPAYRFNYEVLSLHAKLLVIPIEVYLECVRDCALNNPAGLVFSATALAEAEAVQRMAVRTARCAEIDAMARALRKQQRGVLSGPADSVAGASLDSCSAGMLSDFASPGRSALPPGQHESSTSGQDSSLWSTPQRTQAPAAYRSTSSSGSQQQSPRAVRYGDPVAASPRQWGEQARVAVAGSPRAPRSPNSPRTGALASCSPRQISPRQISPRQISPRQVSPRYLRGKDLIQRSGATEPAVPESIRSFEDGMDTYATIAIVEAQAMDGTATVPNRCMDYAVTPAEAARRVREELQAIRARLATKSTGAM